MPRTKTKLFQFLVCAMLFAFTSLNACSGPKILPSEVRANHTDMFDAVKAYHDAPELFIDGSWQKHWGDGAMFGPSFDLAQWKETGEQAHYDRAIAALEVNRTLVAAAAEDFAGNLDNLEMVSMSLLSLLEAGIYLEETTAYQRAADDLIEALDFWVKLFDDYMDIDAGEFAAGTYGPTSLSAFLVITHLEHVMGYPGANEEYHLQRAADVLDSIHEKAWSDELKAYAFAPGDGRLMLYPNITMMLAYARAHALTGEDLYWERFEEIYKGIQPLKDEDGDHYHSPYSAEEMGSTDGDYSTHSSQNYLMMALLVAYQISDDDKYLLEIDTVLTFIKTYLLDGGMILHHWVNGRAATLDDPYLYCLGCNVQTLYLLLMIGNTPNP
ncbi:MAG: hypothetical protein CMH60_05445 [Myxococcales bacterium]|nr:hypothetical protein [Myxococcales bacterium]|tara:strand:+ start:618 stop:1766 length:1149 start_codon:yes stop_codon:yes gene_type:complete